MVGLPRRAARVEGSQLVEELVGLLFVHAVRCNCEPHLPALCMVPPPALEDGEGCCNGYLLLARQLASLIVAERIGRYGERRGGSRRQSEESGRKREPAASY